MEPKWRNYASVGIEQGFNLYKRKRKDGEGPPFAFRALGGMFKGTWGGADNLTDLKIRVDEYLKFHLGLGIATGYRMGGGPTMQPEEIYRKVGIGKYLFREKAVALPGFMAMVKPYKTGERLPSFFIDKSVLVEGNTVGQVKKNIDRAINSYPRAQRKYFDD